MALCLLAGTSAFAQDSKKAPADRERPTAEQMAQKKTERMAEKLKLDEAQSKKLYDVNLQEAKDMQVQAQKMHENRKAQAQKMKSILTPEQYEQWKQMQSQRPGMDRGQRMKDGKMHKEGMRECPKCDKPCDAKDGEKCDKPCSKRDKKEKK